MAHIIIVTTPPGGSLVAPSHDIKISVEYAPAHELTPDQEHHHIEVIERVSQRFYERLQERLSGGGGVE